jgi:CxxC motif-containing protein (DUF1111 family)
VRRALFALLLVAACGGDDVEPLPPSGGDTTVDNRTTDAYTMPLANLDPGDLEEHRLGDGAFEAVFVPTGTINGGLGPTFNNAACSRCHLRDGRGMPVAGNTPLRSHLLVRVSTADGLELPGYGFQLQDQANFGTTPEATIAITWIEVAGTYEDGTPYVLRRPELGITLADGTALPAGTLTSLRQPPPVFGLGLLEAIADETLEALADPDDANGDGISGRVNHVLDVATGELAVGRFGHKSNAPNLRQQSAAAYVNDMGVGSSVFPDADTAEVTDDILDATVFYTQTLAVPGRVAGGERGLEVFRDLGCDSCHLTRIETGEHTIAALSHQTIAPFTDLLVHDLGEELADNRPDGEADGREWRTAPLWGIGLTHTVLPGSGFLHDGRARTLEEAILWHGGEAEAAREGFRTADAATRAALITFLESL